MRQIVRTAFADYKRTLVDDRRVLVERYEFVDLARKVVGVGSVGTLCLIALLTGRDDGDPLFLQLKQAGPLGARGPPRPLGVPQRRPPGRRRSAHDAGRRATSSWAGSAAPVRRIATSTGASCAT